MNIHIKLSPSNTHNATPFPVFPPAILFAGVVSLGDVVDETAGESCSGHGLVLRTINTLC